MAPGVRSSVTDAQRPLPTAWDKARSVLVNAAVQAVGLREELDEVRAWDRLGAHVAQTVATVSTSLPERSTMTEELAESVDALSRLVADIRQEHEQINSLAKVLRMSKGKEHAQKARDFEREFEHKLEMLKLNLKLHARYSTNMPAPTPSTASTESAIESIPPAFGSANTNATAFPTTPQETVAPLPSSDDDISVMIEQTSVPVIEVVRTERHPTDLGGYADIWWGTRKSDGLEVALKGLRVNRNNRVLIRRFVREASIWSTLDHVNVLPFLGVALQDGSKLPYMVSPWSSYGNVMVYLEKYPEASRQELIRGLRDGLSYLHANGIVHGDIKERTSLCTIAVVRN